MENYLISIMEKIIRDDVDCSEYVKKTNHFLRRVIVIFIPLFLESFLIETSSYFLLTISLVFIAVQLSYLFSVILQAIKLDIEHRNTNYI